MSTVAPQQELKILTLQVLYDLLLEREREEDPTVMTVDGPVPAAALLPKVAARITELEAQAAEVTA